MEILFHFCSCHASGYKLGYSNRSRCCIHYDASFLIMDIMIPRNSLLAWQYRILDWMQCIRSDFLADRTLVGHWMRSALHRSLPHLCQYPMIYPHFRTVTKVNPFPVWFPDSIGNSNQPSDHSAPVPRSCHWLVLYQERYTCRLVFEDVRGHSSSWYFWRHGGCSTDAPSGSAGGNASCVSLRERLRHCTGFSQPGLCTWSVLSQFSFCILHHYIQKIIINAEPGPIPHPPVHSGDMDLTVMILITGKHHKYIWRTDFYLLLCAGSSVGGQMVDLVGFRWWDYGMKLYWIYKLSGATLLVWMETLQTLPKYWSLTSWLVSPLRFFGSDRNYTERFQTYSSIFQLIIFIIMNGYVLMIPSTHLVLANHKWDSYCKYFNDLLETVSMETMEIVVLFTDNNSFEYSNQVDERNGHCKLPVPPSMLLSEKDSFTWWKQGNHTSLWYLLHETNQFLNPIMQYCSSSLPSVDFDERW